MARWGMVAMNSLPDAFMRIFGLKRADEVDEEAQTERSPSYQIDVDEPREAFASEVVTDETPRPTSDRL